jgi:hypothetical protein
MKLKYYKKDDYSHTFLSSICSIDLYPTFCLCLEVLWFKIIIFKKKISYWMIEMLSFNE